MFSLDRFHLRHAAITTAAIGAATAIYTTVDGVQRKADAKKALENLDVPEHENPYKTMRVSREGSNLIKEEGQRRTANLLEGLQSGGARNMLSALPSLVAMNDQINQKAKLDIDSQMLQREKAVAGYEERRNQIDETRYQNELAGIGNMYNQGEQQMWNGINSGITSIGSLGRAYDSKSGKNGGFWGKKGTYGTEGNEEKA